MSSDDFARLVERWKVSHLATTGTTGTTGNRELDLAATSIVPVMSDAREIVHLDLSELAIIREGRSEVVDDDEPWADRLPLDD